MKLAKFALSVVLVRLSANAIRLAFPKVRAQVTSVVPYTVVLAETITDPTGRRSEGPLQMFAGRSDGAVMARLGLPSEGRRTIYFASGLLVQISDRRKLRSTTRRAAEYAWARDAATNCATRISGLTFDENQSEPHLEQLGAYRAARIQVDDSTKWFALDFGCALIKQRLDFGRDGTSDLELISLTPGEPDPALFSLPNDYAEAPPSAFLAALSPVQCTEKCQADLKAHFERLDHDYYRHQ